MKIVDGKLVKFKLEEISETDEKEKKIIVKVPQGVTTIPKNFLAKEPIDIIHIPDSVTTIEDGAFSLLQYLERVKGMRGVTTIGKGAFEKTYVKFLDCPKVKTIGAAAFKESFLEDISFGDDLTEIGANAFNDSNVKEIILPKNLVHIGDGAFSQCKNLTSISIPSKLTSLPSFFCDDSAIEKINIPKNIKVIGEACFNDCSNLEEVNLEYGVTTIANNAFHNCGFNEIYLPDSIESIGANAFEWCELDEVTLPKNLVFMGNNCFSVCDALKSLTIGDKLETISNSAFYCCSNLKKIKFGKNVKVIEGGAFARCSALQELNLPDGLEVIEEDAFSDCNSLKNVEIPSSVKYIGHAAFSSCDALEKIYIPGAKDLEIKDSVFGQCDNLKEVVIEQGHIGQVFTGFIDNLTTFKFGKDCKVDVLVGDLPFKIKYLCKSGEYFIASESPIGQDFIELGSVNEKLCVGAITGIWEDKDKLNKMLGKRGELSKLINDIYFNLGAEKVDEFVTSARFKFYDQCKKYSFLIFPEHLSCFYSLGGFSQPIKEERTSKKGNKIEVVVDYAQKAGEFFKMLSDLSWEKEYMAKDMKKVQLVEFNPEAANFLLDLKNIREITFYSVKNNLIGKDYNFLNKILSNFKEVQETNKSRKGSQRQLAPTVERFKEYFSGNKFSGVQEQDRELAEFLSKYYVDQATYDAAVKIKREREENGTGESILGKHLKEDDAFKEIDALSLKIKQIAGEAIDSILESTTDYIFDWLERSDPNNYVLGRLCNCCAELESAGYGIMHASIVNPDVQNLVIRDKSGKIVAKSTLYVNRDEGYGVFNNIQISDKIPSDDKIKIYKKFKVAVAAFAKEYNNIYSDKPLKQINIGMRINNLDEFLEKYDKEATDLLVAIDYGRYGRSDNTYNGDSTSRQIIVWENEKQ